MLKILTIPVTLFFQNARVLWCSETKKAAVVDPGGDIDSILKAVDAERLELEQIWLTHSHLDHCGGVAAMKRCRPCVLCAHGAEAGMRAHVTQMCEMFDVPPGVMENCPEPERYTNNGDVLQLGDCRFEVLFAPGHSPGHVCFYAAEEKTLITGDVLFAGSVGRTDLPGSNGAELKRTLRDVIMVLPDDTKVLAGHGPDTTIGAERAGNPFLKGGNYGWL